MSSWLGLPPCPLFRGSRVCSQYSYCTLEVMLLGKFSFRDRQGMTQKSKGGAALCPLSKFAAVVKA
jgi:hypothetical protein